MGRRIGNVGTLNIVRATKESIEEIEEINNVGLVLYSRETAHLLPLLNAKNIGKTLEIDHDTRSVSGSLTIDSDYLMAFDQTTLVMISGLCIIAKDVTVEQLKQTKCELYVSGVVYTPPQLYGATGIILKNTSGQVITYDEVMPKFTTGHVKVTKGYLTGLDPQTPLLITGKLTLDADLDLKLFNEKIANIMLTGKATLYKHQEEVFHKKTTIIGKTEVIPTSYLELTKPLTLSRQSIKRFKQQSIYLNKPIFINKSVSREAFKEAFASIHSTSYIVCHEDVEDLVYESLHSFETEVISYENAIRSVDKEDWQNEDIEMLGHDTTLVVQKALTLSSSVAPESLSERLNTIHLFGTIYVDSPSQKAAVQYLLETAKGEVIDRSTHKQHEGLDNIGELTL
ncbi:hypothetical protein ACI2JA_08810 [Alkalihalobacillus sp. NPDC078783]